MIIQRETIAENILQYLKQQISLQELVDWAEHAVMEGEFEDQYFDQIHEVVSKIGLADVAAFGLSLQDCEQLLRTIGYKANIQVQLQSLNA
ncbi:hypothetical protein [Catalinimonas niigatensis]|uniref:hypothetical protein n=1 Tax=Catalinimonas niigatensis TaxID=1397264 RepID=UPI002665778A|nr:hypothetical protein [Catalinimonas niigatensis]WPP48350.1 hypothetical protein PZB72_16885 [Catalinimonas niigatensis]